MLLVVFLQDLSVLYFAVPPHSCPTPRVALEVHTLLAGLDVESMGREPYYATRRSFHSLHSLRSLRRPRALSFTADVTDEYE